MPPPKKPTSLPPELAALVYEYAYEEMTPDQSRRAFMSIDVHLREHAHHDDLKHLEEDKWRADYERRFQELVRDVRALENQEEVTGMHSREQLTNDYRRLREENELLKTKARERWHSFLMTVAAALVVTLLVWVAGKLVKM